MLIRLLALALAASAVAQEARLEVRPVACHHEAPRQDNGLWREELDRLQHWLDKADHRSVVRRDPQQIARYHALPADQGGPLGKVRWFPHWIQAEADGSAWEVPFARINSVAVPAYTPDELRRAPERGAQLLEFVPLADAKRAVPEPARTQWLQASARGRPSMLALAEVLGADALVVDGFVQLMPSAVKAPFRRPEVLADSRRQLREERRQSAPQPAATHRFLGFEALAGFDAGKGLRDAPASVLKLDGARVVMVGRMLPLDEIKAMPQFLLCQDWSGDDWGRPPALADMVHVHAPVAARIDWIEGPVRVQGTLRVKEQRGDGQLVAIYQLEAEAVSVIE